MHSNTTNDNHTTGNHAYRVKAAVRKSSLPPVLRHLVIELADRADWDTGTITIRQAELASGLGYDERTLRRHLRAIRSLPGSPWVTCERTAGLHGFGRGADKFRVQVGDALATEEANRTTLSGCTQEDKSADPRGQNDGPKRTTLSASSHSLHSLQIERGQRPPKILKEKRNEKATKSVPLTADCVNNPSYVATGTKLGLTQDVITAELLKLVEYEAGKTRSSWEFRVKQWLTHAAAHSKKPANANYIASVSAPQTEEQRSEAMKARAESDAAYERFQAKKREYARGLLKVDPKVEAIIEQLPEAERTKIYMASINGGLNAALKAHLTATGQSGMMEMTG